MTNRRLRWLPIAIVVDSAQTGDTVRIRHRPACPGRLILLDDERSGVSPNVAAVASVAVPLFLVVQVVGNVARPRDSGL